MRANEVMMETRASFSSVILAVFCAGHAHDAGDPGPGK